MEHQTLLGAAAGGALGRGQDMKTRQVRLILSVSSEKRNDKDIERVRH
jgi:hypothetical protein